jgi:hypothetical protein
VRAGTCTAAGHHQRTRHPSGPHTWLRPCRRQESWESPRGCHCTRSLRATLGDSQHRSGHQLQHPGLHTSKRQHTHAMLTVQTERHGLLSSRSTPPPPHAPLPTAHKHATQRGAEQGHSRRSKCPTPTPLSTRAPSIPPGLRSGPGCPPPPGRCVGAGPRTPAGCTRPPRTSSPAPQLPPGQREPASHPAPHPPHPPTTTAGVGSLRSTMAGVDTQLHEGIMG